MIKKIAPFILVVLPLDVFAKTNSDEALGLNLGLAAMTRSGLYVGEKRQSLPFPTFSYEGERLFLRGAYGGVHLFKTPTVSFNAILSANFDSLDKNDLSQTKLAKHNLKREQLEDRDRSADMGFEATWNSPYGSLSLQGVGDIGNASKAAMARVNYQYFWSLNERLMLIPNLGVSWLSDKRANYYYGTLDNEVKNGIEEYHPDSVMIPHVSFGASYNINKSWRTTAIVTHEFIPHKVVDSPLIDQDSRTSLFLGISRKF